MELVREMFELRELAGRYIQAEPTACRGGEQHRTLSASAVCITESMSRKRCRGQVYRVLSARRQGAGGDAGVITTVDFWVDAILLESLLQAPPAARIRCAANAGSPALR